MQTIIPHGLWITEFSLSYIQVTNHRGRDHKDEHNHFPVRRSPSLTTDPNREEPNIDLQEASIGFRIVGDIHDRYWTCYTFLNRDVAEADTSLPELTNFNWNMHQRRVLEQLLVLLAIQTLTENTEQILEKVDEISRPGQVSFANHRRSTLMVLVETGCVVRSLRH